MSAEFLAAMVRQARHEQRLTQEDVDARGGPSVPSLRTIEHGRSKTLRGRTLRSLDVAFGWPVGTASAAFRGEDLPAPEVRPPALDALVSVSVTAGRMRVLSGFSAVAS